MFLKEEEKKIVKDILNKIIPDSKVLAFGSRVSGKNLKPFSDLDLAIIGNEKLPLDLLGKIKEEFSNSDLPFVVDIVDYNAVDKNFAEIIQKSSQLI
jgi:predicted nucleotidyltransferase